VGQGAFDLCVIAATQQCSTVIKDVRTQAVLDVRDQLCGE